MVKTLGAVELEEWMRVHSWTKSRLARELKVAVSTVSRWIDMAWRPSHEHILAIQRLTGIVHDKWLTAAERRAIDSVEKGVQ